jgi:dienelactone hydrolase
VEAGLGYLKTRKEVDVHKIGLIGHSEGGVIAPMVAANNSDVAFVVLMAGTGVTGDELAAEQLRTSTEALGYSRRRWGTSGFLRGSARLWLSIRPTLCVKLKCPVLAINGSKDRQVLARPNLDGIRAALEAGGNTRFDVEELPGLNHLFQSAQEGWPVEYGHIKETIAPEALNKISNWIAGRAILPAAGY